jgi:hypothetical protein
MSQPTTKITLICQPNVIAEIENALTNSGILFTKEELKEPTSAYAFYVPEGIMFLSVILNILENRKDQLKGKIELSRGRTIEINEQGIIELRTLLIEAMSKKAEQQPTMQIAWWTPFVPEIKEALSAFIEILKWYPKATGEGKKTVVTYFVLLISFIVLGMGVLTFYGKVSGDAFVFVVGALIGYVFAFLQKFLGILGD